MEKNKTPQVSVIITTKNEVAILETLLKSLTTQTYSNTEIIIVDNHSTDNTAKLSKKYTENFFLFGPERSAQRNFGAKNSKGTFLFFLDADMELTPRVIEDCTEK